MQTEFCLGTPTIVGEALQSDLGADYLHMFAGTHGGKYWRAAFGSYGWSGEGVPHIIAETKAAPHESVRRFSGSL